MKRIPLLWICVRCKCQSITVTAFHAMADGSFEGSTSLYLVLRISNGLKTDHDLTPAVHVVKRTTVVHVLRDFKSTWRLIIEAVGIMHTRERYCHRTKKIILSFTLSYLPYAPHND